MRKTSDYTVSIHPQTTICYISARPHQTTSGRITFTPSLRQTLVQTCTSRIQELSYIHIERCNGNLRKLFLQKLRTASDISSRQESRRLDTALGHLPLTVTVSEAQVYILKGLSPQKLNNVNSLVSVLIGNILTKHNI